MACKFLFVGGVGLTLTGIYENLPTSMANAEVCKNKSVMKMI